MCVRVKERIMNICVYQCVYASICMYVRMYVCVWVSPECWIDICAYTLAVEPATIALLALHKTKLRKKNRLRVKAQIKGKEKRKVGKRKENNRRGEKRREMEKHVEESEMQYWMYHFKLYRLYRNDLS